MKTIALYTTPDAGVTDGEATDVAGVIGEQMTKDVAPAYGMSEVLVIYAPDPSGIPDEAFAIQIAKNVNVPGALAYHTENARGRILGQVGVATCKADRVPWSSAADHEVIEGFINPFVDQWVQHGLSLYAKEACDPVQDGTYIQGGVALSNFVVASWFDGFGRGPFDYLGQLGAPFTRTAMGYFERMTAGRVVQVGARGHDRHARIVAGDTWGASLAALR